MRKAGLHASDAGDIISMSVAPGSRNGDVKFIVSKATASLSPARQQPKPWTMEVNLQVEVRDTVNSIFGS